MATSSVQLTETNKTKDVSIPGGFLATVLYQFWALRIVANLIVVKDMIRDLLRPCPKIDINIKRPGQVCVLTGATKGIGLAIVKKLLKMECTVICGARNIPTMEQEVENMRKSGIVTGQLKIIHLDLKSLRSVKAFATRVLALPEARRIDMLINHAGIYQYEYETTDDDFEVHFQVNFLSHFLLTDLLLPRIKATAKIKIDGFCHIVNTTSCLHYAGSIDFDNLAQKKFYVPIRGYFDSKLCQILHANLVQRQLEAEKVYNIQMYAAHPGAVPTDVWIDAYQNLFLKFFRLFCRTTEGGADVILYPALEPTLAETCGGKYFESGELTPPNSLANDVHLQNKLYEISRNLVAPILTG